ncbi:hypothetical protein LUZ63_002600 [Rhynchospora breviuscula]|uniref:KIB1-4 beta-propeller domain-containing protein n=1 Tax=Rhynchospora breviuscula TaxID=2022672 RepID=A0A9Q0HY61_9POAL|nr:hypothetical protein LUZ63_002600 [Rhynchospora breviuscula]
MAETPDWSGLFPELLQTIARKLPDISDFVNFRAVCTVWRSSAHVSDLPPQLPWLLEERGSLEGDLRFYSLFSGKIHTVPFPNSSGNSFCGPAHDSIVLYNKTTHQISLLNPIADKKVVLPSLSLDIAWTNPIQVGPDPIWRGDSVVLSGIFVGYKTGFVALYQPIEKEWMVIERNISPNFRDTYYNGLYFLNKEYIGTTEIINTVTQKMVHVVPPPPKEENCECCAYLTYVAWRSTYLVQSAGNILRVVLHTLESLETYKTHFHIHRLDLGGENEGKPCWVKISSIGDRILFLDNKNGFSLSCRDFSGFRGNSIYFLNKYSHGFALPLYSICRYDIEEARVEPLTCPFANGGTWIVPSLR